MKQRWESGVGHLDLQLLRAFDALLHERHVTRAAERIGIGQSSMSLALARLRELLGDPLLVRSPGGWAPTEHACGLWPKVQDVLAAVDRLFEPDRFEPGSSTQVFKMIVIDYVDMLLMPGLLRCLRRDAPKVRIHLLEPSPAAAAEMMANGALDLALTYYPSAPGHLKARRLFSDRFVGLAAKRHPVHRKKMDAAEFCDLAHITIEPNGAQFYNTSIDQALAALGLQRNVQMIRQTFLALAFTLEATDFVSCVPERLARELSRIAPLRAFDLPFDVPSFDVRMVWHPRTGHAPPHTWLRDLIASSVAEPDRA